MNLLDNGKVFNIINHIAVDMVSITDFNFGAMENWGLIIYVERAILFNEAEDTDRFKEIIARIVCHEIVHQVRAINSNNLSSQIE